MRISDWSSDVCASDRVLGAGVLTDDHALVDRHAGTDEELAPLLEGQQRVAAGLTGAVGDQGAVAAGPDLAGPRLEALEHVVQQRRAAAPGEPLGAEADEATSGHQVVQAHPSGAVVPDLLEAPLAHRPELLDDAQVDRTTGVWGQGVSARAALGGSRN